MTFLLPPGIKGLKHPLNQMLFKFPSSKEKFIVVLFSCDQTRDDKGLIGLKLTLRSLINSKVMNWLRKNFRELLVEAMLKKVVPNICYHLFSLQKRSYYVCLLMCNTLQLHFLFCLFLLFTYTAYRLANKRILVSSFLVVE